MFTRTADRYPVNIAIINGDESIAYGELEREANKLANFLLSSGAGNGSVVAVLVQDPIKAIAAILGILKAGCAFAPLDAGTPAKRLELMMQIVKPQVYVVESALKAKLENLAVGGDESARAICLDEEVMGESRGPNLDWLKGYGQYSNTTRPEVKHEPDDICYIYFTSGSTGLPKAIAGRLRGMDHFIRWEIQTLGLGEKRRVSHLLPLSFDASLRDVLAPLCSGGTVCTPPDRETILSPAELRAWINHQRLEVAQFVPSLLRTILNEDLKPDDFASLKYILSCGEPLLPSDVGRLVEVFGERIRMVNLYGPTETTFAKFFYFVNPADKDRRSIPIGKPMPGARAVVVGKDGSPCPRKVAGEIYIRTPYRSLGYYRQPELTEEVFIQNPFSGDPDDLVYKTGDLARVLDDGNYEFLGRKDDQVKIRGVRIEIGEIEGLLRAHEAVKDVAVVAREDARSQKYLCAYVVLRREVVRGELREYLAGYLPAYMVPSQVVVMEQLPLTISGKVDRRALPKPEEMRSKRAEQQINPRTPVEEIVAGIWKQVLGVKELGVDDNFFDLGGHSLLATQVMSRVRDSFEVELPLRTLFENPTVARLAATIERERGAARRHEVPPIQPVSRDRELPLSFAQRRLWFLHRLDSESPAYNIPHALRFRGELDLCALRQSLREVVRRHEVLRTRFEAPNSEPLQVVEQAFEVDVPVWDFSALCDAEHVEPVRGVAAQAMARPFDLARGPVFRVALGRVGNEDHVLFLCLHHVASDGWSVGVLVRELTTLYQAYRQGLPATLAELPVQYADYAVWQREWLRGEILEEQLGYWRERLADLPPFELPTDRPRPAVPSLRGAKSTFTISPEMTRELREVSRREGVTLFMTLLAAFKVVLSRHAGRQDVVIGTDVANRNRLETEGLIGFFVNQLVLRTDLSGDPTFREALRRVKETTLGAYAHQDVPFEKLVEELSPERHLSRTPLFQVRLLLHNMPAQNAPIRSAALDSLSASEFQLGNHMVKFDLSLRLAEGHDGLQGSLEYNSDLFAPGTVNWLLSVYEAVLNKLTEPENLAASVSVLMAAVETPLLSRKREQQYDVFRAASRRDWRKKALVG